MHNKTPLELLGGLCRACQCQDLSVTFQNAYDTFLPVWGFYIFFPLKESLMTP